MSEFRFNEGNEADTSLEKSTHWVTPVLDALCGDGKHMLKAAISSIATRMENDMKLSREQIIAEIRHYGAVEFFNKYKAGDTKALAAKWHKGTRRIHRPDLSGRLTGHSSQSNMPAVRVPSDSPTPEPGGLLSSIREMVGNVSDALPFPRRSKTGEMDAPDFDKLADKGDKDGEAK